VNTPSRPHGLPVYCQRIDKSGLVDSASMPSIGQAGTIHDNGIGGEMIWTKKNGAVRHFMIRMTKTLLFAALLLMLSPNHTLASHKASQAPKEGDMAVTGCGKMAWNDVFLFPALIWVRG